MTSTDILFIGVAAVLISLAINIFVRALLLSGNAGLPKPADTHIWSYRTTTKTTTETDLPPDELDAREP